MAFEQYLDGVSGTIVHTLFGDPATPDVETWLELTVVTAVQRLAREAGPGYSPEEETKNFRVTTSAQSLRDVAAALIDLAGKAELEQAMMQTALRGEPKAAAPKGKEPPYGKCGMRYHHATCECGGAGGDR